jgi:glucokinase
LVVVAYHDYACAAHASLEAIVRDFVDRYACGPLARGVLACAGCVIDGIVINDNLPWRVNIGHLRRSLQLDDLALINDFEAVAHGIHYLDPDATMRLPRTPVVAPQGIQVVVGPGTGLGSAVLLPDAPGSGVLGTEAGQMALAPHDALEDKVLSVLARKGGYVSYEQVLSGPGLVTLYRTLCTLQGANASLDSPAAVTRAARTHGDPLAYRTVQIFCAMLGGFVGDLAMACGASGGVWLAGGILPRIRQLLARSSFVERFHDKGSMRTYLERISVRLMEHGQLGVIGAASWYLDHVGRIGNVIETSGGGRPVT